MATIDEIQAEIDRLTQENEQLAASGGYGPTDITVGGSGQPKQFEGQEINMPHDQGWFPWEIKERLDSEGNVVPEWSSPVRSTAGAVTEGLGAAGGAAAGAGLTAGNPYAMYAGEQAGVLGAKSLNNYMGLTPPTDLATGAGRTASMINDYMSPNPLRNPLILGAATQKGMSMWKNWGAKEALGKEGLEYAERAGLPTKGGPTLTKTAQEVAARKSPEKMHETILAELEAGLDNTPLAKDTAQDLREVAGKIDYNILKDTDEIAKPVSGSSKDPGRTVLGKIQGYELPGGVKVKGYLEVANDEKRAAATKLDDAMQSLFNKDIRNKIPEGASVRQAHNITPGVITRKDLVDFQKELNDKIRVLSSTEYGAQFGKSIKNAAETLAKALDPKTIGAKGEIGTIGFNKALDILESLNFVRRAAREFDPRIQAQILKEGQPLGLKESELVLKTISKFQNYVKDAIENKAAALKSAGVSDVAPKAISDALEKYSSMKTFESALEQYTTKTTKQLAESVSTEKMAPALQFAAAHMNSAPEGIPLTIWRKLAGLGGASAYEKEGASRLMKASRARMRDSNAIKNIQYLLEKDGLSDPQVAKRIADMDTSPARLIEVLGGTNLGRAMYTQQQKKDYREDPSMQDLIRSLTGR